MLHTGDRYELRARAARHRELRRLTRALSDLLQAAVPDRMTGRRAPVSKLVPLNNREQMPNRAA